MEKKLAGYYVNWSINNVTDELPYEMDVEIHNAIYGYARNARCENRDYNKARSFEYLQKILCADFRKDDEYDAFMSIFTEDREMQIAYAGVIEDYQGDRYVIVAFSPLYSDRIDIYGFETWNECDMFKAFQCEEEEEEEEDNVIYLYERG